MKKFISENWYKLMIGSSLLMASFGFLLHSISPIKADNSNEKINLSSNYRLVPTNEDGSINVKLSDEQLNKIALKSADGNINVKLSNEQIDKLRTPNGVQEVTLSYCKNCGWGSEKWYFLADENGVITTK
jgi:hypothetical protein